MNVLADSVIIATLSGMFVGVLYGLLGPSTTISRGNLGIGTAWMHRFVIRPIVFGSFGGVAGFFVGVVLKIGGSQK